MSWKQQYLLGVKAGIPVILGFIPVGIAYAIMNEKSIALQNKLGFRMSEDRLYWMF